jgi:hypothetical protein
MNQLTLGIIVFVAFNAAFSLGLVSALRSARAAGLQGQAVMMKILPYLLAEGLLTIVFLVWFVSNLQ